MTSFMQDVQYALRMIAKAPGYAAITILTLALGIGANTTIFSWINASLLNPVPGLKNPREVVALSLNVQAGITPRTWSPHTSSPQASNPPPAPPAARALSAGSVGSSAR